MGKHGTIDVLQDEWARPALEDVVGDVKLSPIEGGAQAVDILKLLKLIVQEDMVAQGRPNMFPHPVIVLQGLNEATDGAFQAIPWSKIKEKCKTDMKELAEYIKQIPQCIYMGPGAAIGWRVPGFDDCASHFY